MEERELKVIFGKAGSGSTTTRLTLPKKWINAMNITEDEREVLVEFDGEKIIIKKAKIHDVK
jgi:hypothetical protein